ncbi:MAG: carbon-nitrogen hydrolase family protein [Cyclobacteriaceae bacterium]
MKVKACVIQESPVFFDKARTIEKLEALVKQYAAKGCQLIVFPESFIPGYPRGFNFGATVGSRSEAGRDLYNVYWQNSVDIESDDLATLVRISKESNVYLVIGVTEKNQKSKSLYCSMLYISPGHGLMGVHRKVKPTGVERLIWAESGAEDLVTFNSKIGRLGGLICWENYMPHIRTSILMKGIDIYIAPTADSRAQWTSTMIHIALEGRCFVLGCNQYFRKSMYPSQYQKLVVNEPEELCEGGSVIVGPDGKVIAGPLFGESAALIAELNLDEVVRNSLDFDHNGHYQRNDLYEFKVSKQPPMKQEGD